MTLDDKEGCGLDLAHRLCPPEKVVSDESKLLTLTQLYLELRLEVEHALRAAQADLMVTSGAPPGTGLRHSAEMRMA